MKLIVWIKKKYKQGFTLLEILVAILLISILMGGGLYMIDFGSKKTATDILFWEKFIFTDMNQALFLSYGKNGRTFTGMDTADVQAWGKMPTKIPGDLTWAIHGMPNADSIIVRMTFPGISIIAAMSASDMARRVNARLIYPVQQAIVNGPNLDITYIY